MSEPPMTERAMTDENYRGPARITVGEREIETEVRLSARFEPVEGRYRWAGRTAPDVTLLAHVTGGGREATLRISGGEPAAARLSEPDPWGGVRLTGTGTPPWADAGQSADGLQ
jgi:Domain of unknown function (DUF4873)